MNRFSAGASHLSHITSSFALAALLVFVGCDGFVATDLEQDPRENADPFGHPASIHGSDNAVLVWGEACLQTIRDLRHGPPMTGRTLAIVHTAMYDAWAAYDPVAVGTRLGGPGGTVGAEPDEPAVPVALQAPYPNPFTGYTTIGYEVAEAGRVRLSGYDVLGREVAVLVDAERAAGHYETALDMGQLAAGVYVARLTAGGRSLTRRLTVLR